MSISDGRRILELERIVAELDARLARLEAWIDRLEVGLADDVSADARPLRGAARLAHERRLAQSGGDV